MKPQHLKWIVLTILFGLVSSTNPIGDIRTVILETYNPHLRPVRNHYDKTSVKLGLSVTYIHLDERDQLLTVICNLRITWNDEFLTWLPGHNETPNTLYFDRNEIWVPDIALYNSAKNADVTPQSNLPILVYNNGNVLWTPHFTAQVPCLMDISLWPSDKHTCVLNFGSWAQHGEITLDVPPFNTGINFQFYHENDRWRMIDSSVSRKSSEAYGVIHQFVEYKLTMQRLAASHAIYISQTTLTIIVSVLSSYFLPLRFHLSRLLLHLFALVALIICNIIMFVTLPATSGHVPFVVKYFSGAMILTTLSLLCQVITTNTMTQMSATSFGIRGFCQSLFGFSGRSSSTSNLADSEITYSNMEEDNASESYETDNTGSSLPQRPQTFQTTAVIKSQSIHNIHRVINIVLFCLFSVAFVVDYSVLRTSIGY